MSDRPLSTSIHQIDPDASGSFWYNVAEALGRGRTFNFILGGRGIGKTFSAFRYCLDTGKKFMLLRRTGVEYEIAASATAGELRKQPGEEAGRTFAVEKEKGFSVFYRGDYDEESQKFVPSEPLGYASSLATFSNLRGAGFDSCDVCIFDEFVREPGKRNTIRHEATAFYNFYETAFRRKRVPVLFLSNSVSMNSPILADLDLIKILEYMIDNQVEFWEDEERDILIQLPRNLPISDAKRQDPIYKLTAGSAFAASALDNEWIFDDRHAVRRLDLRGMVPVCGLVLPDDTKAAIYRSKDSRRYYAARTKAGSMKYYSPDEFRATYGFQLKRLMLHDKFNFSDYALQLTLEQMLK